MVYFWQLIKHFYTQGGFNDQEKHVFFLPKRIKTALCAVLCSVLTAMPAFAAGEDNSSATTGTTVWTKPAKSCRMSTRKSFLSLHRHSRGLRRRCPLLLMNFSKNGKTVDDSRAWLKRIAITWAILNGLGFIMAYVTPFFQGGTFGIP